jgi:Fe2+ or Zn2+ uptake regulation protein
MADLAVSDLVTVYRNLEVLHGLGLLQRIVLEDGVQLFEAVRRHGHFHHIICRKCHATQPLHTCFGHELEALAREAGFDDIGHVIEVFGICSDCSTTDDDGSAE